VNASARNSGTATYPYLIVRVFAALYQPERIRIRVGMPAVDIVHGRCCVQHPSPFEPDGSISPACRLLLVAGVQDAVKRGPFRMSIVWAPRSCTFVETDGTHDSANPPSGGHQGLVLEFKAFHFSPDVRMARDPGFDGT